MRLLRPIPQVVFLRVLSSSFIRLSFYCYLSHFCGPEQMKKRMSPDIPPLGEGGPLAVDEGFENTVLRTNFCVLYFPSSVSFADTFPTGGKARDVIPSIIRSCPCSCSRETHSQRSIREFRQALRSKATYTPKRRINSCRQGGFNLR